MKKWAIRSIGFALACILKIGCNTADAADGADTAVQTLALAARGLPSTYRIAFTADGNTNDPDDIGATPLALAIFAAFGVQDRDEPGNSTFRLIVNGTQRDFWTASANDNTWKNRIKTGVTIRIGYEVVVEAIANSSERIRLDTITFTRTGSAAAGQ